MQKFFCGVLGRMGRAVRRQEEGMGVIEIILIIVVLISLVFIFKTQLTALVGTIFGKISQGALSI